MKFTKQGANQNNYLQYNLVNTREKSPAFKLEFVL